MIRALRKRLDVLTQNFDVISTLRHLSVGMYLNRLIFGISPNRGVSSMFFGSIICLSGFFKSFFFFVVVFRISSGLLIVLYYPQFPVEKALEVSSHFSYLPFRPRRQCRLFGRVMILAETAGYDLG